MNEGEQITNGHNRIRKAPVFSARIEKGAVCWHGIDGKRFNALKTHLEGQEVEIVLRKKAKKRSLNQNDYYWGCVIEQHVRPSGGFDTKEEAHDAMRMHFLTKYTESLPTVRSTTELSTVLFEEYLDGIRKLAMEMWGDYIPLPNEIDMESITA